MIKVYVAGSLRQPDRIIAVTKDLIAAGFAVFSEWVGAGPEADDHWKAYNVALGRTYREALEAPAAINTFLFDKHFIDACDVFVLVMPAGKSGHLELGYAIGCGKPGFFLMDEPGPDDRWDVMAKFANDVCYTTDELARAIRQSTLMATEAADMVRA